MLQASGASALLLSAKLLLAQLFPRDTHLAPLYVQRLRQSAAHAPAAVDRRRGCGAEGMEDGGQSPQAHPHASVCIYVCVCVRITYIHTHIHKSTPTPTPTPMHTHPRTPRAREWYVPLHHSDIVRWRDRRCVQQSDDAGARRIRTIFFLMVYKVTLKSLSRPPGGLDSSSPLSERHGSKILNVIIHTYKEI